MTARPGGGAHAEDVGLHGDRGVVGEEVVADDVAEVPPPQVVDLQASGTFVMFQGLTICTWNLSGQPCDHSLKEDFSDFRPLFNYSAKFPDFASLAFIQGMSIRWAPRLRERTLLTIPVVQNWFSSRDMAKVMPGLR